MNVHDNRIKELSRKEREIIPLIFKRMGITDYTLTDPDQIIVNDAEFTYKGIHYLFELKTPNYSYNDYDTIIIAKNKLDYLAKKKEKLSVDKEYEIMLGFIYPDNTVVIVPITQSIIETAEPIVVRNAIQYRFKKSHKSFKTFKL